MRQVEGYALWVGNVGDIRQPAKLFQAGISAVIDLAMNEPPAELPREFVYCRFPLVDGSGNPLWLLRTVAETLAALIRAETATLIYCGAGMSRTPAIVAAGLALAHGLSPVEALRKVCGGSPADVSPALWADVQSAIAGY